MRRFVDASAVARAQPILAVDHQTLYGGATIGLVTVMGALLALQGWRSVVPAFDMLPYFENAAELLESGTLPRSGDVSSYGSFSPPGTSWLMVPGMIALADPRLIEKVGSIALHFGTLVGVFSLAREAFGPRCGYLSVVLYGLSALGLSFAASLWPIGHPFFYVWLTFFAVRWVISRDARYLAVACAVWAVGLYVDMAIAPGIAVVPAMWLFYRPPLLSRGLLLGGVFALAVWYPYLQFEVGRGFVDLRSQWLRQSIAPMDYERVWCDPSLALQTLDTQTSGPVADTVEAGVRHPGRLRLLERVSARLGVVWAGLLVNFRENASSPVAGIGLLLVSMMPFAAGGITAGWQRAMASIARWRRLWGASPGHARRPDDAGGAGGGAASRAEKTLLFTLALGIPWLILLLAAEPGRPERFFWLWPLQVIALSAVITNISPRIRVPRLVSWVALVAVVVALLGTSLPSSLGAWRALGWGGPDAEEMEVVRRIAVDMRTEHKSQAAVGYQVFFYPFMANYHAIDPGYKVGAEFDFLFAYQHGIQNTNTCAEGVSPHDEYRVVQATPKPEDWAPRAFFAIPPDRSFHLLGQVGSYQIFKRD